MCVLDCGKHCLASISEELASVRQQTYIIEKFESLLKLQKREFIPGISV